MSNLPTILSEMDDIREVMRTDRAAYTRNEGMQARYRSLIAQRDGASTILDDGDSSPVIPIYSAKEYAAIAGTSAGFDQYLKLSRTAADWVFALPADDQRRFVASFERLPDDVTAAAFAEITSHRPMAGYSSDKALAAFAELPEGVVLIREWGGLAARNLACVRERLFRIVERLEERSVQSFCQWLDGLSTGCAIALYRRLAG